MGYIFAFILGLIAGGVSAWLFKDTIKSKISAS
jgi:hypothetical protein